MGQTIEMTAKTAEEAIEIALKELDVDRAEVEIDVVSRGKSGILGIGSEPARVRVTLLDKPPDVVTITTEVLESLISKMGISVMVNLTQAQSDIYSGPVFNLEGEDSGLLIGRKGESLKAFQFIVKFLVGQKLGDRANLLVDVEEYQERRYRAIRNLAERVAQRVATAGRSITLEPMPPDERRVVHLALAENSQVSTQSTGFGGGRQVVIHPN